jgi:2-polyprenyl-6-hydroxyphenyl methylase/3-demethylubiquinone-9 3-methyltransferase
MIRNNLFFYDQQAAEWWQEEATIAPLNRLNPLRFQYFDQSLPNWRGIKVLDVGCGGGFTCEFLAKRGAEVWGIDQSSACIEAAKAHAQQALLPIHYRVSMAESLPWENSSFDVVVCVDVLEHVKHPSQVIAEIARVLKPGGMFCFDTINRTVRSRLIMIWLLENLLRQIPRGIHDWHKFITPEEFANWSHSAGLGNIQISGFNLFGSSISEHIAAYRHYQRTGDFQVRFDHDKRVMYIGTAIKADA